jgi:hypothetical protein
MAWVAGPAPPPPILKPFRSIRTKSELTVIAAPDVMLVERFFTRQ